jgi:DNA-binding beta-propeller fold protein YncE
MYPYARLALLGFALALPACGTAVGLLVDEVTKAIDDATDDSNNNSPIVAGTGLVAIDLLTGDREVISDAGIGAGSDLVDPRAMAHERARNRCLVWDEGRGEVVAIFLATGDRTVLSGPSTGTGPTLTSVRALAVDAARGHLLAAAVRATDSVIFVVDLVTGDRTILTGSGTALELPRCMVVEGDRVLVGDASLRAILTVDLVTGDRDILSDATHGQGQPFVSPNGIDLMGADALVLDASQRTLFSVDLATGDRETVSGSGVGAGNNFVSPVGLVFDPAAWVAFVTQQWPALVMLVDSDGVTGDRGITSSTAVGLGPAFSYPTGIALDATGDRVIVLNRATP